ncbi:hypothetical protein IP88_02710 [alpha proteobacterium AAP81b]|nr:hypothetical protein IP88_02710 [alpha proteobacterium AAP81b]
MLIESAEFVANAQETLSYGAVAQCRTAGGIGVGGSIRRQEIANSNDARTPFDANSLSYGPFITYGRPTLGTFTLSATWNDAEYPNRPQRLPGGGSQLDGVRIFQGRFGYARQFGPRLGLNAGVAVFRNDPNPKTILLQTFDANGMPIFDANGLPVFAPVTRRGNTTVGFDAAVDYNSGNRLTAQLSASLRNSVSVNVGARSQRVQQYGLDVGYKLGRAIVLGAGAAYVVTDYQGSFTSLTEDFARNRDKLFRIVGSIDYAPVKLYSIGIEVAHQRRDSDPVEFSLDSTSVRLRLRLNYGRSS